LKEADRLFWLDNFVKAQPIFTEAETLFTKAGDNRNALYARVGRLRADADRTGYPAVSEFLAEQLATPLVREDPKLRLRCLIVKASIDLSIDPSASTITWKEAQQLAMELNEAGWANRAKAELSIIAFLQGNTQEAQKAIAESIMTSMLLGDIAGQVRQLSLVAVGLGELGLNDRALRYADQALKLASENPDVRFPLMANMAKMKALEALGRNEEADGFLPKVLEFVESTGMTVYRADVLLSLADREATKGRTDLAVAYLRQAVESAESVSMPRPSAAALFRLAEIYETKGEIEQAETTIDRAVETTRQLVDMYVLPRQLAAAAGIKARLGKASASADLFEEAADLVEGMLVNVPTAGLRATLIAAMSEIYEGYTDLMLRQLNNPGRAFGIIERARGRAAADALRSPGAFASHGDSPAAREVTKIQISLQAARSKQPRRELLAKLAEAEERLMSDLREAAPANHLTSPAPVSVEELKGRLGPQEAVLEYVLGSQGSHLIIIDKDSIQAHRLPPRADVESLARQVLVQIKGGSAMPAEHLRRLSSMLLPATIRAKKRLIVIPDGALHAFPFDVLFGPDGKDLAETRTVSYSPSSTTLALLRSRQVNGPDRLPLLAVGAVGIRDADVLKDDGGRRSRTTRGMFDATAATLPVLPATEREVESLRATFGPRAVVLKRSEANEATFKREPLDRFRVLHLAVHGVVDSKFPDRSALVLSPSPAEHEDGLLQIREITSMRLNADLVTLSACDTSLGRIEGQEGVANFVRAFMVAGARNIVSALWEVDDSMTAALMERFYFHLSRHLEPAEALRAAKTDLRRRYRRAASMLAISPFVIVGQ
jgi:CHAT domain-containing protein